MYILRRLLFFAFLAGIYLVVAGAYDMFIQWSALREPEMISISELAKNVPSNRHLIVSGGRAMVSKAVEYYRTRHGAKVPNSEIYFIPIEDASRASANSTPPILIVKMMADQLAKAKANGGFDSSAIEGIRMTRWDLEGKAEEYLVRSFGKPAIEKMVVLDYKKEVVGIWQGLGQFVGGLLLIAGIIGGKFYRASALKEKPPQLSAAPGNATPAAIPGSKARSNSPRPATRRRRIVFSALIFLFVVILSLVLVVSSGVWKRFVASDVNAFGDPWADWQLPVRIGDDIQAVRAKLGPESVNGNTLLELWKKTRHLDHYKPTENELRQFVTLYWQERGIDIWFQNERVRSITVFTADWPGSDYEPRMRKYEGVIIAGVQATDGLQQLIQKLGKPTKLDDDKYQWHRRSYIISAIIATRDVTEKGLRVRKDQITGRIHIEDIAPHLASERDKELRREIFEKEKRLAALSGEPLTPKAIFEKFSGRVVEVQALNSKGQVTSTGTGFIWRGNEILTNCHVVEEARDVKIVRVGESEQVSTQPEPHFSFDQDWVQLRRNGKGADEELPSVVCSIALPEVGENITVIGNPKGLTNSLSTGVVAGIRQVEGNQWIQITAPVSPGSSGSPIFDSKGQLIGLATMMVVEGQNLNFATPIGQIVEEISKKTGGKLFPTKSTANDPGYQRRKRALLSGSEDPKEIEAFAATFLRKYSDPEDQADVFNAVADGYARRGQYRVAVKVLRKKIELLTADLDDYVKIAEMLGDESDLQGFKRELRAGILFGVRSFAKEYLPKSRETAFTLGQMFERLQDRQGATKWFNIYLALMLPDVAESTLPSLPKWYQSERTARGKTETDVDRIAPRDPEAYLNSVRDHWLSENEREIVEIMRSFGLTDERAKEILKRGLDSFSTRWWEREVRPKLAEAQWLQLRAKLDERKSMQGGF